MQEGAVDRSSVLKQLRASFESQLRTNGASSIETWLNAVPAEERSKLFEELLLAELRYLIEHGKTPNPADYLARFPEQQTVIEAVFRLYEVNQFLGSDRAVRVQDSTVTLDAHGDSELGEFQAGNILGRYRLEAIIGQGSFGEVWRAYDPELERFVAIKVPRRRIQRRADLMPRFREEARRAASLKQQGIVPVYDIGTLGSGVYIVTELIEGPPLSQAMKDGLLTRPQAIGIVIHLARSLHEAHRAGLVHRDIKPSNILLRPDGSPAISDFGLAITEEEQLFTEEGIVGTVAYMSPEQARGEAQFVDGRSDLYSLGVILFQLLTGRLPFQFKSSKDLLEQIIHREVRPLRMIDDSIPRELERICLKCLAKNITDRYTTGRDLAEDLERAVSPRQVRLDRTLTARLALVALVIIVLGLVIFNVGRGGAAPERRGRNAAVIQPNQWLPMLDQPLNQITNLKGDATDFVHYDPEVPSVTFRSDRNTWLLATAVEGRTPLHLRTSLFVDGWIGQGGLMWGLDMGNQEFPKTGPRCFVILIERYQPHEPLLLSLKELKVGAFLEGVQWVNEDNTISSIPIEVPAGPALNLEVVALPEGIEVLLDGKSAWKPRALDDATNTALQNASGLTGFVGRGKTVVFRDAAVMFRNIK